MDYQGLVTWAQEQGKQQIDLVNYFVYDHCRKIQELSIMDLVKGFKKDGGLFLTFDIANYTNPEVQYYDGDLTTIQNYWMDLNL